MKAHSICVNSSVINRQNIESLISNCPSTDNWLSSIYAFLGHWFDNSEFILIQTSGSTGQPKQIRLSKTAMIQSAQMTNRHFGLDASKTALLALPATYIAGKMMLVRALVGKFNIIAVEPAANPFVNVNQQIDFTAITPYQLQHSIESLRKINVHTIIVGGSTVSASLQKAVQSLPIEIYETYGMTETCSHIALRCVSGTNISDYFTVLDEITIRQDTRNCLAISAPLLLDYEIQTNDIVEMINPSSFRWLGRLDFVINSGGVKIHPELLEKKLEAFIPTNFFVTSLPDHFLENKVVLVIESEIYSDKQLSQFKLKLSQLLSKFEIPKLIFFIPTFKYSSTNKILKNESLQMAIST